VPHPELTAVHDPGVTAQLECLLDEVVIGKQERAVSSLDLKRAQMKASGDPVPTGDNLIG